MAPINSWFVINPAEVLFGIGVCIGIPLLLMSAVFRAFFMKAGFSAGRGWKYELGGLLGCAISTYGLVAVFTVPLFFTPSRVPDSCLIIMTVGTFMGLVGFLVLLVCVSMGLRALLKPRGKDEIPWVRGFIFYVPLCLVLANLLRLYRLFNVH